MARWWGERGDAPATQLRFGATTSDVMEFDVKCGPANFARYLTDMGQLVLELSDAGRDGARVGALVVDTTAVDVDRPLHGTLTAFGDRGQPAGKRERGAKGRAGTPRPPPHPPPPRPHPPPSPAGAHLGPRRAAPQST